MTGIYNLTDIEKQNTAILVNCTHFFKGLEYRSSEILKHLTKQGVLFIAKSNDLFDPGRIYVIYLAHIHLLQNAIILQN